MLLLVDLSQQYKEEKDTAEGRKAPDELVRRLDVELIALRLEQLCEDGLHHGTLGGHCQRSAHQLVAQHVLRYMDLLHPGIG